MKAYKGLLNERTMNLISKYGHREFQGLACTSDLRNLENHSVRISKTVTRESGGKGGNAAAAGDKGGKAAPGGKGGSKSSERMEHCNMRGCPRATWDGFPGQCCRSCKQSDGSSHGPGCERKQGHQGRQGYGHHHQHQHQQHQQHRHQQQQQQQQHHHQQHQHRHHNQHQHQVESGADGEYSQYDTIARW